MGLASRLFLGLPLAVLLCPAAPVAAAPPNGFHELLGATGLPGQAVIIHVAGNAILSGDYRTLAADVAGAIGPNLTIEVDGVLILRPPATLWAADGMDGQPERTAGWSQGQPGGRGGSIHVRAASIVALGPVLVHLGNGGKGGDAASSTRGTATARGGAGGDGGELDAPGIPLQQVTGGKGGQGGSAFAESTSCSGRSGDPETVDHSKDLPGAGDGASAVAAGRDGACSGSGTGGDGGDAVAKGGPGGASTSSNGGNGGNATATSGSGGAGGGCPAVREGSKGGNGGHFEAVGGPGGAGFRGGTGGSAIGTGGKGGAGGNGSPPGSGGVGGTGNATGGAGGPGVFGGSGGGASAAQGDAGHRGSPCGTTTTSATRPTAQAGWLPLVAAAVAIAWRRRTQTDF